MSHARSEPKNFKALAPDASDIVAALGQVAAKAGIDKQLLELIKLRASQINGCAFCVQYHILQSERLGISADKLNLVVVWREAPLFSSRERAALAWTEALTLLTAGVSDEVYTQAAAEFSEKELADLTSEIGQFLFGKFRSCLRIDLVADARGQQRQRFGPRQCRALARRKQRRLAPDHDKVELVGRDAEALALQDVVLHAEGAAVDLRGAQLDQFQ